MKIIFCFLILTFSHSCFGQTGSEIILFDLKVKKGKIILSSPENITHHKGYDNQPSFNPTQPIIYYSSFDDSGRSDIKYYNYKTKQTANLTTTSDREYSPTVIINRNFKSFIIQRNNGLKPLGKYTMKGVNATVLIKT